MSSATARRPSAGGFGVTKNMIPSSGLIAGAANNNPPNQFRPQIFYGTLDTFLNSTGVLFPNNVTSFEWDQKVPTVQSWTLGVQRDLGAQHAARSRLCRQLGAPSEPAAQPLTPCPTARASCRRMPTLRTRRRRSRQLLPTLSWTRQPELPGVLRHFELPRPPGVAESPVLLRLQFGVSLYMVEVDGLTRAATTAACRYISPTRSGSTGSPRSIKPTSPSSITSGILPRASRIAPNAVVRAVFDNWQFSGIDTSPAARRPASVSPPPTTSTSREAATELASILPGPCPM